jgi:hypothetical protein
MTRVTVVIDRDAAGRLHGTVESGGPAAVAVPFTGVIEMVAQIEASLDHADEVDPPGAAPSGGAAADAS